MHMVKFSIPNPKHSLLWDNLWHQNWGVSSILEMDLRERKRWKDRHKLRQNIITYKLFKYNISTDRKDSTKRRMTHNFDPTTFKGPWQHISCIPLPFKNNHNSSISDQKERAIKQVTNRSRRGFMVILLSSIIKHSHRIVQIIIIIANTEHVCLTLLISTHLIFKTTLRAEFYYHSLIMDTTINA